MEASATMTREVVTVPPRLSLAAAWEVMQKRRIRHLPVMQAGRLVGILSDRDVLLFAERSDGGIELGDETVADAMSAVPLTCRTSTPVSKIAAEMVDRKIDAMPVVDAGGGLVGLVTSSDLLLLFIEQDEARILPFEFRLVHANGEAAA